MNGQPAFRALFGADLPLIYTGNIEAKSGRPWFDVIAFGADPTGVVDSTAAIQAAINAARSSGFGPACGTAAKAGIVVFPSGLYLVSSLDATRACGLDLRGTASWGSALYGNQQAGPSKPIIDMTGCSSCNINGLTLHGQNPNGSDPAVLPS